MIQMEIVECLIATEGFREGIYYAKRISKDGRVHIRNDRGVWMEYDRITISALPENVEKSFAQAHSFTVSSENEALNFAL